MFFFYKILTNLIFIFSPVIIFIRLLNKKEHPTRFKEKFGFYTKKKIKGKLVWFHGASVGEILSIIPLIEKLPNKYDTIIGENGTRLSGGEKQRLSIARAMLKKSQIILLDEATSSLDAETENKIQDAINYLTKNRTTIVIAHRLSTILNSDKIYVIDSGNLVGEGTHNELLSNSPTYKNFYEKQIKKM